jgi:hypothetical protein
MQYRLRQEGSRGFTLPSQSGLLGHDRQRVKTSIPHDTVYAPVTSTK